MENVSFFTLINAQISSIKTWIIISIRRIIYSEQGLDRMSVLDNYKRAGSMIRMNMPVVAKALLARIAFQLRRLKLENRYQRFKKSKPSAQSLRNMMSQSKTMKYLEIYLYCPIQGEREVRRNDIKRFFEKHLKNIDDLITGCPIFLDQGNALSYSRFMGESHSILKAYVSEMAIEGSYQELYLKPGYLKRELIHGYYPSRHHGQAYIPNPIFDENRMLIN